MNMTFYYFNTPSPAFGLFGVDEAGSLYLHPAQIGDDFFHEAHHQRALIFIRAREGLSRALFLASLASAQVRECGFAQSNGDGLRRSLAIC
jgi:hypothetical protein